jgi:hypothetical protein
VRFGTVTAVVTVALAGLLLLGADARSKPRQPVAPPVERLVLGAADAPGLSPRRGTVTLGAKAVAAALRPAHLPKLGAGEAARFTSRRGAELWSLAYPQTSSKAAKARLAAIAFALQRARLRPGRAGVGEAGWTAMRKRSTLVAWQRRNVLGLVLLTVELPAAERRTITTAYADVSDEHMDHLLSRTAWERVLGRVGPDGAVSKIVALDLFALAYRPLPGTARPKGPAGRITEGTLAAHEILRNWQGLTAAQKTAAAATLGLRSIDLGKGRTWRRTQLRSAGDYGDPTFKELPGIEEIVNGAAAEYAKKLNRPLKLKIVAGTSAQPGTAFADALPVDAAGVVSNAAPYCRVRLLPEGQKQGSEFLSIVLAHETFPCIQFDVMTPVGALVVNRRNWLLEGMADWAALTIRPVSWDVGGGNIRWYLDTPRTPLFSRTYDAVGFFGHAESVLGDLWPWIVRILSAPTSEGSYGWAGGEAPTFLDSWGSSTFNRALIGFDWYSTRPIGSPPDFYPTGTVPIWSDIEFVDAGPYALSRYVIDSTYGLLNEKPLLHIQINGYARLGNTAIDTTDLDDAWFWLEDGSPKCPPTKEGTPPPARPLGRPRAALALTGGDSGASGTVEFVSLDRYCKEKQKPPKPPKGASAGGGGGDGGNSGGGGGSSFTDPHVVTFDGGWYDFQGAGEYVLARSPSRDLEVQAREQPWSLTSALGRAIAYNTAVAMRVAGDRVGIYTPGLTVHVNGRGLVPTARTHRLPRGGSIRTVDGQLEVRWPDGSIVRAWQAVGVGILVQPAAARQGTLAGMLGNFDADAKNDFRTRSGTVLDADKVPRSYRLLYRVFGDSWRITQKESLFDYARGQSTRTFTLRDLPHRLTAADLLSPQVLRRATRICRRLHIVKRQVFQACLLDVGMTGDGAFATGVAQAERTAGGFPKPQRLKKTRKGKKTKGSSTAAVTWTRVTGKPNGAISVSLDGGKVVAAYRSGQGAAEAITFTPSTSSDAVSVRKDTITTGWDSIGDPLLVGRAGGGLQALLTGIHGGNNDPLNGVSFAVRNANGSFGPPSPATTSTFAESVVGKAVVAPDGAPIWVSTRGGTLWLWRGPSSALGVDLSALAGGPAGNASVARDAKGRYWLAWNTVFSSQAQRNGLYLVQFDPATLKPIGNPLQAPSSADVGYGGRLPVACGASCRYAYLQRTKVGVRIVSWAPGEKGATTIVPARAGHSYGSMAVAYAANGRLWVAWWDNGGNAGFGYRALLGDARGAKGTPFSVGRPPKAGGGAIEAIARGNDLVLVAIDAGPAPYVNVLAPR